MPRFSAGMAFTMLVGREFYRFGYLSKEGPSSQVREVGAIALNVAGIALVGMSALCVLKRQTGGFFAKRKSVRYFTHTPYDVRMEKVVKDAEFTAKGFD